MLKFRICMAPLVVAFLIVGLAVCLCCDADSQGDIGVESRPISQGEPTVGEANKALLALLRSEKPRDLRVNTEDSQGEPTVGVAKEALLALLRSERPRDLRVNTEELSQQAGAPGTSTRTLSWGPFFIDLSAKTYDYSITYFAGTGRSCTWRYQGKFELRQGHWFAQAPRLLSQALGRG